MITSTDLVSAPDAYDAPQADLSGPVNAAQMAFWIFIVLIVVILTLGGVAIFCILKGHRLEWAQKGWTHWRIACG
ncbi:hypothetical protein ACPPVT_20005 [Angustibacter sp. McL0619]|uniref:hypothetical protein n=1 Tax=Angustibacter sp. McL0619 TaxID=3415676 RepID=UPI003CF00FFF